MRRSAVMEAMLRKMGMAMTARPETDGMKSDNGMSTAVSSQNKPRTVRARSTTSCASRTARPVFSTAPPTMNAPIINHTTSDARELNRRSSGLTLVRTRSIVAPRPTYAT